MSDGNASKRIAQKINETYQEKYKNKDINISLLNIFWPFSVRSFLATSAKMILGKKLYAILSRIIGKKYFIEKLFFKVI